MKTAYVIAFFVLVQVVTVILSAVTPSEQCDGHEFDDLRDRIQVIPCGKTKCRLKKGQNTTVVFRFKPKEEVRELRSHVYASIAGLPLPFIGVDGVSACEHVQLAEDGSPSPCPLQPGREYTYKNVFPIYNFYPSVPLRVHWGLNDGTKDIICFEVPAAIVG